MNNFYAMQPDEIYAYMVQEYMEKICEEKDNKKSTDSL